MSTRKILIVLGLLVLGCAFVLAACSSGAGSPAPAPTGVPGPAGPAGPQGPAGPAGPAAASAEVETCAVCHKDTGAKHQASYEELYQDGVIKVSDLAYRFTPSPDTTIITFKMTKNGVPISGASVENLAIYFVKYDKGEFVGGARLSLKGKLTYDPATGVTTSTLVELKPDDKAFIDYTNLSNVSGLIVLYGRDQTVGTLPARINQAKYPFAAILNTGAKVDYVSSANDAGCVKCHTDPYLKHGYIYAQVNGDPATDFLTCKACHMDDGEGEHLEWKLLVEDPPTAAGYLAGKVELTEEQKKQYEYKTSVMNDVHQSHAMEFPYPQSMSNCVTCHEGKLDKVLADENFTIETCKSCHPVTGAKAPVVGDAAPVYDTTGRALKTILPELHASMDLETTDCLSCHAEGKTAPVFKAFHSGYDKTIYTADGVKYADAIKISIDKASFDGTKLDIQFSAAMDPAIPGVDLAAIKPSVLVGLYGWDTKDFIVGAHERLIDDNADGALDSKDSRNLEFEVGAEHPRMATVSAAGGKWEVTADLSAWADLLKDGTVKRVEIGVLPALDVEEKPLAISAVTRTFDLGKNDFDDKAFGPIAKVDGCNSCHTQLATTFHEPAYGGSITACRMCHITKSGGSHLEMQSRSLDSYIHAIHSGQAFDVSSYDFADPVQAMYYNLKTEFPYPTHGSSNCLSCHVKGTFNVPDQSKSLPGLLSASSKTTNWERNISGVPSYVTGPAVRACGACHRVEAINTDSKGEFLMITDHFKSGGYFVEAGDKPLDTLMTEIKRVMGIFK